MKSVDREVVSSLLQARWPPQDFHQGDVVVFSQSGRICVSNQDPDQFWNVSALSAVPLLRPLTTWVSTQQQASQPFHDMYGGYCPTSYLGPGRLSVVGVAIAIDSVLFNATREVCSAIPASGLVVPSLPESPSAGPGTAVSTRPVPFKATPTATQPAVMLFNQENL